MSEELIHTTPKGTTTSEFRPRTLPSPSYDPTTLAKDTRLEPKAVRECHQEKPSAKSRAPEKASTRASHACPSPPPRGGLYHLRISRQREPVIEIERAERHVNPLVFRVQVGCPRQHARPRRRHATSMVQIN